MAKVALLIGVSEYGEGLSKLPGTQTDIQTLHPVLQNPQIGGFDSVQLLPNPDRAQMEYEIEKLFSDDRSRDDLILLYFSGHGVRDDDGTLYFATCNTEKSLQGQIRTSTAVSATELQRYMGKSRSKRQVLILDCCFSGAFANDMKAKADEAIDVKAQLGSEGRAVLTSSTATQLSFEQKGASIYTRYLVQGLETGAADRNEDGHISVDELHEYAREKVQEAAPTMRPEIYAAREGYKILIARAPQGDPKLVFRKEVDARAKQKRGKFSPIDRRAFQFRWQELGLLVAEAEQITSEILQPYQEFWAKLEEFDQAIKELREYDPQFSATSLDDLRYFQRVLKLRDEDIAPVLATYQLDLNFPDTPKDPVGAGLAENPSPSPQKTGQNPPPPQRPTPTEEIPLESEKGIDYSELRNLLKAGEWKKADQATAKRMLQAMNKKNWWDVGSDDLLNFPCKDLKTIDRLWVHYSKGHFGFSVQKKIWQDCSSPKSSGKTWDQFCVKVGWQNKEATAYVSYSNLNFDQEKSPVGELPASCFLVFGGFGWVGFLGGGVVGFGVLSVLFSRTETCEV